MDNYNDLEEQYLLLEEEEKKENKKKFFLLLILFIFIIIISIIGATFSYEKFAGEKVEVESCKVNCHTDKDKKPDLNIDYENNGKAHFNIDTDGDLKPDFNLMNQDINKDSNCDLNCDNNKDGWPDFNIDLDGDGIADLFIKEGGSKLTHMDTNGDGICDVKCDGIETEVSKDEFDNIVLEITSQDKAINYIGRTKVYIAENIIPGWKDTIEFKIVNKSSENAFYRIRWDNIINTITEENNITYKLSKNNRMIVNETRAPYDKEVIISKAMITPNTTFTYKMELEFKETGVNQNIDLNKMFKALIKIEAIR